MALGVLFIRLKAGYNVDLFGYLFGSILSVSSSDIWLNLASGATIVLTASSVFFLCFVSSPKRRRHQASAESWMIDLVHVVLR